MNADTDMKRVLVVEDDPLIQKLVENFLRTLPDVDVVVVADARSAMNQLQAGNTFRLVCLDLMLPEVSGFELCRRIRELPGTEELPILVVSARTLPADRAYAAELGANGYVTKPFSRAEFLKQVRSLVGA